MNPLRIGVDGRPLLHPTTGIGRYTQALLEFLLQSDHSWFLYFDRHYEGRFKNHPNVTLRCTRRTTTSVSNLWISQVQFSRWARQDQLDVFWSPRHHLPLLLPAKINTVVTVHDLVWQRFPETMKTKGRWTERLLMPASLKRADALIAVSKFTAREIDDLYPQHGSKTGVVYEAAFQHPGLACGTRGVKRNVQATLPERYFLFVGTNEPRKNLDLVLDSFKNVIGQDLSIGLVLVAGKGWGQPQIIDQLKDHDLQDKVVHMDSLDDASLDRVYRQACGLLLPSLYEGFGLPVLEAMTRGVPVIVSDKGALPEIVGDGGLVVNIETAGTLQSAMKRLCEDEDLRSQLSAGALRQAAGFSWQKAAKQTLDILEAL